MTQDEPPVWVLAGHRTGDNNQLLRLAGELGLPFRTIELGYNGLHRLPPRLLGATVASLDAESRSRLRPPWPKLVLGIGNRSVPAALAIRRMSGGTARLVRLGNPRLDPRNFDLVITTAQYSVPDAPNVLRLPVGISTAPRVEPSREESEWLARLPRPHRLLLVGGDTFMWRLTPDALSGAASALRQKAGGSVIAVSSARSGKAVLDSIAATLAQSDHALVWGRFPRYPVLLADADEIHVTADSAAMISDSIATRKPVALIEPRMTLSGRFFYGLQRLGIPVPVRDVRRFWTQARDRRLAGTVERPLAGTLDLDPLAEAVSAIRPLLGG